MNEKLQTYETIGQNQSINFESTYQGVDPAASHEQQLNSDIISNGQQSSKRHLAYAGGTDSTDAYIRRMGNE